MPTDQQILNAKSRILDPEWDADGTATVHIPYDRVHEILVGAGWEPRRLEWITVYSRSGVSGATANKALQLTLLAMGE